MTLYGSLIWWIEICLVIAAFGATTVPVVYAFSPWYKSRLGRLFMLQAFAFALAMDFTAVFHFWPPDNITVLFWTNAIIFTLIAASTLGLTWKICKYNYLKKGAIFMTSPAVPPVKTETSPLLSNKNYNQLKWFALIVLPGLATLYFALSQTWDLPKGAEVVATITSVNTFLGLVLGISTKTYNESEAKYDGHILVEENEDGVPVASLHLKNYENPADVVKQDQVIFKVGK